jgi:pimeloyl-ACP methyl ester carboxylesterase
MEIPFEEFGSGKDLILLHAFPLSRKMWKPNIESLVNENFRVITPDLRGFGENNNFSDLNLMEDMANDIAELLEVLEIEKAIIGGLSMGGYVTFELYKLFPEKFSALILCDTTFEADTEEKRNLRFELIKKIGIHGSKALVENTLPNLISDFTKQNNKDLSVELEKVFLECPPESAIAALRGMAERNDHTNLLDKIIVPTLLIFGEQDKITNLKTAEQMHEKITDSELFIIKNAGHYSNLENPSEFNSALLNFIQKYNL